MPSALPLPTVAELVKAYGDGVTGLVETRADVRSGSAHNLIAGPNAILTSRQTQRDRDLFRACYTDTAEGDDLTNRIQSLYGISRLVDAYGVGTATLSRPTVSAGAGTIYAGTRILTLAGSGATEPRQYVVTQDTAVAASAKSVTVPIRAPVPGAGTAFTATPATAYLRIDDVVFDASLSAVALTCADGTSYESSQALRARAKQARVDSRRGYLTAMTNACIQAGASNVVFFAGNWGGDATDGGLNVCYVGDSGYSGSTALVSACAMALESWRVLGADLQVLPMAPGTVNVAATVSLWDDPGSFNLVDLNLALTAAVAAYFDGRKNAFAYQLDAIRGAMLKTSQAVQDVTISIPASSATITSVVNGLPQWPATLTHWTLPASNITLTFQGPQ